MRPLDRASRLPLLMAMLLAAALIVQLLAPGEDVVPPSPPMRPDRASGGPLPQLRPATGSIAAVARLFGPLAAQQDNNGQQTGDASAAILVMGSVQVGRRKVAVIQRPDGRVSYVRPGGSVAGWHLQRLAQNEAVLRRGSERVTVPFGGRASSQSGAVEEGSQ